MLGHTRADYVAGHRCPECREANRLYAQEWRVRRKANGGLPLRVPPEHGTYAKYVAGCGCRKCLDGKAAYERQQGDKWRGWMAQLKNGPCTDCGVSYPPYVMEFDHLPGHRKAFELGASKGKSLTQIMAEIAKCELVCANCHRERTEARRVRR